MPHPVKNKQGGHTDNDFWTKYGSVNPRMTLLVLVTPQAIWGGASEAIGFTSNSRNMRDVPGFDGITFKSTPAITPTAVEIGLDEPGNLELTGIFNTDSFSEADILAGKWNFAELKVMSACWDDLDLGQVLWHRGYLGETKTMQTFFTAESRGLLALLSQEISVFTSRLCGLPVREFQDEFCGHTDTTVEIEGTDYNISHTLTVSAVTSPFEIVFTKLAGAPNNVPDAFFKPGKITALGSTANGGVSREIRTSDTGTTTITLFLKRRFPFTVTVGDEFLVKRGCDRTIDMCVQYENVINRRAEDWTPTVEAVNRVPAAN